MLHNLYTGEMVSHLLKHCYPQCIICCYGQNCHRTASLPVRSECQMAKYVDHETGIEHGTSYVHRLRTVKAQQF